MKIKIIKEQKDYGTLMEDKKIHLAVPASDSLGFGMTRAYLSFNCKMDDYTIERFINQVNNKNEVGSLYPSFNLALFPTKADCFSKYIKEIFEIEINYVKSNHLVFDFFANSFNEEDLLKFTEQLNLIASNEKQFDGQVEIRTNIR